MKNLLIRFYYFICSIILKYPRLIVFSLSLLISFLMNSISVEASVSHHDLLILKRVIPEIVDDFNQNVQAPAGLPPVFLNTAEISNIILFSDNADQVCDNVVYSLKIKAYKQGNLRSTFLEDDLPIHQQLFILSVHVLSWGLYVFVKDYILK